MAAASTVLDTASAPPTEPESWAILLSVDGLGPAGFGALLAAFGSGLAIVDAAGRRGAAGRFARIAADGDGRPPFDVSVGERIVTMVHDLDVTVGTLRASGLTVVTLDDARYPARLRAIELPPPVLLVRGEPAALSARRSIAIVGTRRPTERGRLVAARIGAVVARSGAVVVSGLAVGIDGAAHAAVVAEQRPTVGVLGSGHERLFPRAHRRLAGEIAAAGGAVISDLWPATPPSRHSFPRRNRIISGLSDVTIVVEAGLKSGALITARWALEQGREVFVVPGPIDEPRAAGCLSLLRELPGEARIVAGIPELVADLELDRPTDRETEGASRRAGARSAHSTAPSLEALLVELGPTARDLGAALVAGHGSLDELVAATGHEPATVLGAITLLELRGLATSTYGRYRAAGRLASAVPATLAPRTDGRLPARRGPC